MPEKTFLDWCKEYETAIDGLTIIIKELEAQSELSFKDYAKYNLLIISNKNIKEYAEKQISVMLDNEGEIPHDELINGLDIVSRVILKEGLKNV